MTSENQTKHACMHIWLPFKVRPVGTHRYYIHRCKACGWMKTEDA
jgi:hypothetical protein